MANGNGNELFTPVYFKTGEDDAWPEDSVFYRLTSSGLFICRNTPFYRSCVPARTWPAELAAQRKFMRISYPKVPRELLERSVGFFDRVAELYNAEAALAFAWDREAERMELIVPEQVSKVSRSWRGKTYPQSVKYEIPALPSHLMVVGDIHCHVDYSAYASYTDKDDESYRPGLHIVVGRIRDEPPDFHIEAVVDGTRFTVEDDLVLEGYEERRRDFPEEWLDAVKIEHEDLWKWSGWWKGKSGSTHGTSTYDNRDGWSGSRSNDSWSRDHDRSSGRELVERSDTRSDGAGRGTKDAKSGAGGGETPMKRFQGDLALVPELLPEDGAVKIIGLGGVGGIVARYLSIYLASLHRPLRLFLIDGDAFEATNASRMLFPRHGNKASVISEELGGRFESSQLSLYAIEEYVTAENIDRLIREGDTVILAVDNHKTRKLVNDFCAAERRSICLISGGNDGVEEGANGQTLRGTYGNCQVFIRRDGEDASPSLTRYHPEIQNPTDRLKTELSCGELAVSVPQILFTNLTAAATILNSFWLYVCGALHYSEIAFDIADGLMQPVVIPAPKYREKAPA